MRLRRRGWSLGFSGRSRRRSSMLARGDEGGVEAVFATRARCSGGYQGNAEMIDGRHPFMLR